MRNTVTKIAIGASALVTALFIASSAFAGGPWFVSTTGNDANDCLSAPTACLTIQAAVNKASAGDTINVAAGTYSEHVAVNKAVTINGANAGIAGNGVRGAESIVNGSDTGTPFAITANNVTINGFTIENGSNGGFDAGIWSQTGTQNSSILNNIITGNAFGIWAQCGANCLIQANLFDANNKVGTGAGSASISADATNGLTIHNNEFKNDTAGNPILLQAVGAGAHTNVTITNNNLHNNTNSNIYVLGTNGGTISNNTITPAADSTGISFSGLDANITVMNNTITGGARGVRIEDAGYYGVNGGGNSNITINRNSVANDTTYGVGNVSGYTGNVNAMCNWWGAASGPGPVGPGTGSPVTANVDYSSWLTTSALDGACNGPLPATVKVTIDKFIDGSMATAASASSSAFSMNASWSATNIGSGSGTFTLSPVGFNSPNAYEAITADMSTGASYSTNEQMNTVVGANCAAGKPFALVGYTMGTTSALAAAGTPTTTAPSFTNLQSNEYVIVWNHMCPTVTPPPPTPTDKNECKNGGWMNFTNPSFKNQGQCVAYTNHH